MVFYSGFLQRFPKRLTFPGWTWHVLPQGTISDEGVGGAAVYLTQPGVSGPLLASSSSLLLVKSSLQCLVN